MNRQTLVPRDSEEVLESSDSENHPVQSPRPFRSFDFESLQTRRGRMIDSMNSRSSSAGVNIFSKIDLKPILC